MRVVKDWNRLPGEIVESAPMEMLKVCLEMAPSTSEQVGWTTLSPEVASHLCHAVIL